VLGDWIVGTEQDDENRTMGWKTGIETENRTLIILLLEWS
jgi:hypothetical protein